MDIFNIVIYAIIIFMVIDILLCFMMILAGLDNKFGEGDRFLFSESNRMPPVPDDEDGQDVAEKV